MEKGKSVINKYNIRSIVSLGVVQSEEIYNQHTPSLANHNKLMHIQ